MTTPSVTDLRVQAIAGLHALAELLEDPTVPVPQWPAVQYNADSADEIHTFAETHGVPVKVTKSADGDIHTVSQIWVGPRCRYTAVHIEAVS